jgi:hypothetical protein
MGYHFGEGVAIEGDMIVRIRLYGTSQVRAPQIRGALLRAAAPVARGIRFGGLFGQILGQDTTTPAPTGV